MTQKEIVFKYAEVGIYAAKSLEHAEPRGRAGRCACVRACIACVRACVCSVCFAVMLAHLARCVRAVCCDREHGCLHKNFYIYSLFLRTHAPTHRRLKVSSCMSLYITPTGRNAPQTSRWRDPCSHIRMQCWSLRPCTRGATGQVQRWSNGGPV
jgi:hypothetical protein